MYNFLSKNNVIAENQFGFLPKSSTTTAVLHTITRIKQSLDEGHLTAAVCIDIAKAFDSVKHDTLLEKLIKCGIGRKAHDIIQDYLFGRKQVVAAGKLKSDPGYVKYGIPQGSNLSSLLFLIYINGCLTLDISAHIQMYADDAILIYSCDTYDHLKASIQEDLITLDDWLYNNFLTFNADKTKLMLFKKSSQVTHQALDIIMNGTRIEEVIYVRYLGLIIDEELNWKQHHEFLRKKLTPFLFVLRRTRYSLSFKTKLSLYYSYIHSHLSYLVSIWGYCNATLLDRLQVLQNKAVRSLFWQQYRTNNLSTQQLFEFHNIPRIKQLRVIDSMLLIHKIKYGQIRNHLTLPTFEDQHSYNTRNKKDFVLPRSRSNILYNSLLACGLSRFNNLPDVIKREPNFCNFKRSLRRNILHSNLEV